VLYAPGLRSSGEIRAVADAVSKPLNVLAHAGLTMAEIADAGGRRVSLGGGLTWVAMSAAVDALERMRDGGDFSSLTGPGRIREWLGG
jgi:2-methylisocitrate lyase-like PEP mutase family enzyme